MDVLIIEDNEKCRESLKLFFENRKAQVFFGSESRHGELLLSIKQFDIVIIDLLLPQVNGLEFLEKIKNKKLIPSQTKVWISSGIIKENFLSKKHLRLVSFFLKKPFITEKIDQNLYQMISSDDTKITKLFNYFYMSQNSDAKCVFKSKETIEAHQLMFVCMRLCQAGEKGRITFSSLDSTNFEYELTFHEGRIVQLSTKNKALDFENLLLNQKVVDPLKLKQVKEALKPGQSLEAHLLKLKIIDQSMCEKILRTRFEKFILEAIKREQKLSVKWSDSYPKIKSPALSLASYGIEDLVDLMQIWIKDIATKWVQQFFLQNKDYRLNFVKEVPIMKSIKSENALIKYLQTKTKDRVSKKLSQYLTHLEESKKTVQLKMLYCRFLLGECFFSKDDKNKYSEIYYKDQKIKYDEFLEQNKNRRSFDVLQISSKSSMEDIEMIYKQIIRILHPDLVKQDAPKPYLESREKLLNLFNSAYNEIVQQKKTRFRPMMANYNKKEQQKKASSSSSDKSQHVA